MLKSLVHSINRQLLIFSLIMGLLISWMIRNQFTRWLFDGKGFDGRNPLYKFLIIFLLLCSTTLLIYWFGALTNRAFFQIDRCRIISYWFGRYSFPAMTFLVAIFAVYFFIRYSGQPILEAHGFRQTQTALTSYWMIRDGWKLAYETPVVGYPWTIPFEFPIYQALVALISQAGNFPLENVGRLLSSFFLLACAWPAWQICERLHLSKSAFWIFVSLLWSSPFYLFWGRTFMIETAALFFILAATPYFIDLLTDKPASKTVILFIFWTTLGVLQKTNTAIPAMVIMALVVLTFFLTKKPFKLPGWRTITIIFVSFFVPVLIGYTWSNYTNLVREENIVGQILTSWPLTKWMMGSFKMRFDPQVMKTIIWDRIILQNAGGIIGVAILLAGFVWGDSKLRKLILICLALFIFPMVVFTNVHYIHDYYQASSILFLLAGLAISISSLIQKSMPKHFLQFMIVVFVLLSNYFWFSAGYGKTAGRKIDVSTNYLLSVSDVIRNYTDEQSAIVIFGNDWSSELGYYSERKSFAVMNEVFAEVWQDPQKYLGGSELGALINCLNEPHPPSLRDFLLRDEIRNDPYVYQIRDCYIWMPRVQGEIVDTQGNLLSPIDYDELLKD